MDCNVRNANYERVRGCHGQVAEGTIQERLLLSTCVNDIAAIALNYLPPHYYVDKEESKEVGSPWVMVETAVVEAIDRVMENPNHSASIAACSIARFPQCS